MLELVYKPAGDLVHWIPAMFAGYVEERIGAGESRESAWTAASAQSSSSSPVASLPRVEHVLDLMLDGHCVGVLWMGRPLGRDESTWFVFYVEIDEAHRGQGLGREAMLAAERWSLEHGGSRIALNVFGPNTVARSLYELGSATRCSRRACTRTSEPLRRRGRARGSV